MNFKSKKTEERSQYMNALLYGIMLEMVKWIEDRSHHATITETVTTPMEDKRLKRKSATHNQGRAFDLRTWDLPDDLVRNLIKHFDELFGHLGAVSSTTGKTNLIVWHNAGTGKHLHVQLNPSYAMNIAI